MGESSSILSLAGSNRGGDSHLGRNASGSFAYLRKTRPLEYVDNRTFEVFFLVVVITLLPLHSFL